ncbi:MAG: YdcF family protein [Candidatus Izemoplasmatales bacterium]
MMKVAVVLGHRLNDNKTITEIMEKRLTLTIKLIHQLSIEKIIVSGGVANKKAGISEAEAMEDYLIQHGVEKEMIIKEDHSLTTAQNAQLSVPMAIAMGADTLVLCSTKEHLHRWYLNPIKLFKKQMKTTEMQLIVYSDGHINNL